MRDLIGNRGQFWAHCKFPVEGIDKKVLSLWYGKAYREDPLKLLLPGVIYDDFELIHTTIQELINRKQNQRWFP